MENSPKVQWYNGIEASTAIAQDKEPTGEGYWVNQSMMERRGKYETVAVIVSEDGSISEHPLSYISLVKEFDSSKKLKELEARVENATDMSEFTDKIAELEQQLADAGEAADNTEVVDTMKAKLDEAVEEQVKLQDRIKELEGDLADANAELEELTKE